MHRDCLFYTHSNEAYGHFVLPFMYFALMASPDYWVEVWARDAEKHEAHVRRLNEMFGNRAELRNLTSVNPAISRFREQPITRRTWTYISDIDILTLDPHLVEWHAGNLDGRCYSNAIREPEAWEKLPRLTGLMFVDSVKWYAATKEARAAEWEGSDEMILAQIAFSVWPEHKAQLEAKRWARPVPGVHISQAREPWGCPGWEITGIWLNDLRQIEKHETWAAFWEMTSEKWKQQYNRIKPKS